MSSAISCYYDAESRKTINGLFLLINNVNIRLYNMLESYSAVQYLNLPHSYCLFCVMKICYCQSWQKSELWLWEFKWRRMQGRNSPWFTDGKSNTTSIHCFIHLFQLTEPHLMYPADERYVFYDLISAQRKSVSSRLKGWNLLENSLACTL
jgi:hypothetical protein